MKPIAPARPVSTEAAPTVDLAATTDTRRRPSIAAPPFRLLGTPGAHAAITDAAHTLNHDAKRAAGWTRNIREPGATMTQAHFLLAFPFSDAATRIRIAAALARNGM